MLSYSDNADSGKRMPEDQMTLKKEVTTTVAAFNAATDELTSAPLRENLEEAVTTSIGAICLKDVSLQDLEDAMARNTLRDEPADKEIDRNTQLVQAYLLENVPEFRRVMAFRDRGWNSNKDKGDTHFKAQREHADTVDDKGEKKFFDMMINIAEEMDAVTGALHPTLQFGQTFKVLDVCMAPGGYSAAVLKVHPRAEIYGITLDKSQGGHSVLLKANKVSVKYADVTMFSTEILMDTDKTIPKTHPDYSKFNPTRPFRFHKVQLVLLDGIVLRTHERASYRQQNEPLRLSTAQLVLGLQRLQQGGNLVMLMRKVDSWAAVNVIYTISKFASIHLFKPKTAHATRSSFYLVARNVNVQSPSAASALAEWKSKWYDATVGGSDGTGAKVQEPSDEYVLEILKNFGEKLIKMGIPLWNIQADALSRTSYAGEVDGSSVVGGKDN